ncbi:MAG: histidine phosphatase family protein, partial [Deltaproteobacteria bacterium]|nr:histidine phosphatase family protein [Deltaproteobacteria bacterium]
FQQIYCSDLVRARQTADILADGTNRWVNVRPAIREINLGQWDGLTAEEVRAGFPGEWEKRGQDIATYRPLRGESFADLAGRVIPAFEQISGQSENRIAVVGHAGVNRVILCHVLGMPIEYVFRLRQDYGALNIIEGSVGSLQVGLMNLKPEWSRARFARHIIEDKSKIT